MKKSKHLPSQNVIPKTNQLGFGLENINLTDDLLDLKPNNQADEINLTIKLDRCNNMMETKPEALENVKKNEARLCLFDIEKRVPITAVWHIPCKYDVASHTWDFNNAESKINELAVRLDKNTNRDKTALVVELIVW